MVSSTATTRTLLPAGGGANRCGAVRRYGVRPVGVALPSDGAAAGHLDELVLEGSARRDGDGDRPQGVGAGVL